MEKERYEKLRARRGKERHKRAKGEQCAFIGHGSFEHSRTRFAGNTSAWHDLKLKHYTSTMIGRFLSFMCAGDVLNAVGPMSNPQREITRAMIAIQHLKRILLRNEEEYTLIELNPGLGLTGVLAAHLFPTLKGTYCFSNNSKIPTSFEKLYAIKKMGVDPGDAFHEVRNLKFVAGNFNFSSFTGDSTVGDLAETWNLFRDSGIDAQESHILLCTNAHPAIVGFLAALLKFMPSLSYPSSMFKHAIIIPTASKLPEPDDMPEPLKGIPELKETFWVDRVTKLVKGYFSNYKGSLLPMGGTILYPKKVKEE
jgi:hypothetical protein